MPDRVKEKLIELIRDGRYKAESICNDNNDCQRCTISDPDGNCKYGCIADHLIANGVTVQEWISVKDRLPDKHGKPYVCLLTFPHGGQFPYILNWHEYGDNGYVNGRHFQDEGLDGMKVTHWMPLPQPPKGE